MALTTLDIWNAAIVKAGGRALQSVDEVAPLADFCKVRWPTLRDKLTASNRWVFLKERAQLVRLSTTPAGAPFTYGYTRPGDLVGAIHDFRVGPLATAIKAEVLQLADYIASDEPVVWIEYTAVRDVAAWPPWFVELAIVALAADVARQLLRRTLATELMIEAYGNPEERGLGGLMGAALNQDGRNAPLRSLEWEDGGALVQARTLGTNGVSDPRFARALLRTGG